MLGTAFTPEQVKRISGFTSHVELLFDGDGPGRKAALRACEMLLTRGLSCKVVLFPEGEDIDSLLRTQGTDIFEDLRRNAPEGMAFCVRCLRDMAPREAVDWAREFLRQVELPELVSRFASTLSTGLGLAESELRERIIDIPFCGGSFQGCICAIVYGGREYRLATYRGVRILNTVIGK